MMKYPIIHKTLTLLIASVWLINGLYCKILNQVPRHETIIAHLLSTEHSRIISITIGVLEVCLAIWILTGYKQKTNAILQISIVLLMNCIEALMVPELLLWQRLNVVFALLFVLIVYLNNFHFNKTATNYHVP